MPSFAEIYSLQAIAVDDAQKRFDKLLDIDEKEPVTISSDGKTVAVPVPAEEYKKIQRVRNRER